MEHWYKYYITCLGICKKLSYTLSINVLQKRPRDNPFDLAQSSLQRFYFNNSSGVILPGETMRFPFVFKSPNAGVFQEQWQFETRPVVCGGAALIVTLRGIAFAEDKFREQRIKLEVGSVLSSQELQSLLCSKQNASYNLTVNVFLCMEKNVLNEFCFLLGAEAFIWTLQQNSHQLQTQTTFVLRGYFSSSFCWQKIFQL